MPSSSCADRPPQTRTRLEASLARLHAALQSHARLGATIETLFGEWQNRWSGRRDEIVRRLEAIDSQLETWLPPSRSPRLAVVSASDETMSPPRDMIEKFSSANES